MTFPLYSIMSESAAKSRTVWRIRLFFCMWLWEKKVNEHVVQSHKQRTRKSGGVWIYECAIPLRVVWRPRCVYCRPVFCHLWLLLLLAVSALLHCTGCCWLPHSAPSTTSSYSPKEREDLSAHTRELSPEDTRWKTSSVSMRNTHMNSYLGVNLDSSRVPTFTLDDFLEPSRNDWKTKTSRNQTCVSNQVK